MGEEAGKEPEVKLPRIIVEFTSPESAMFDCYFQNMHPLAANYQLLAFSNWLRARCDYFMKTAFDKQFGKLVEDKPDSKVNP